jgi:hypothetical protein
MSNIYLFIKLITCWNWIKQCTTNYITPFKNICSYIWNYKNSTKWGFIPGYTIPMSLVHISNNVEIPWTYDSSTNTLQYILTDVKGKLSWLSAKITIYEDEKEYTYDIDPFIESFTVYSTIAPSVMLIFMCWCVHTKKWFSRQSIAELSIITAMGEEKKVMVYANHAVDFFEKKSIKIYKN